MPPISELRRRSTRGPGFTREPSLHSNYDEATSQRFISSYNDIFHEGGRERAEKQQELQGCPLRIALPPPLADPQEALGDTLTVDGTQEISTRRSEKNLRDEAPSTTTAEVPSVSTFSNPFYIATPRSPSLPTPQSPSSPTSSLAASSSL